MLQFPKMSSLNIACFICGILHTVLGGNSAVQIEGAVAQSLPCKDSEFLSNFDVVP